MKAALHTTRQAIPDAFAITRPRVPNLGEDKEHERGWVERMSNGPENLSISKPERAGFRTYFLFSPGSGGKSLLAAVCSAAKARRGKGAAHIHAYRHLSMCWMGGNVFTFYFSWRV